MIRSSWLLAACAVAFGQHAAAQCEQQKFLGTDTVDYDYLGHGVSIEGDLALVPAYWKSVATAHDGKVYVVRRVAGVWTEEAQLTASVPLDMAWLGYSTSLSGSRALIGALREGPQGVEHGGAYVFAQVGGAWVEEAHLVTDTPDFYGGFGVAVALQDELALVGAWGEFNDFGVVHVYQRGAHASWNQGPPIVAGDGQPGDYFGCSIALDGDTAAVGAMHVSVPGALRVGAVYVFRRDAAGDWSLEQKLPAPQAILDGRFGYDVALQGDRLVAGAPYVDGSAARSGAVYVFERAGSSWSQVQVLTAPDGAAWDQFGYSVALSGDRIAVGAPYDDVEHDAGSAYVFERAGGAWSLALKRSAPGGEQHFGDSVALDGADLWVGAPGDVMAGHFDSAAYALRIDGALHSYCATAPNSFSSGARISSAGGTSIAANDFVLVADGAPPGKLGKFFYGPAQVQLPFGNGLLCAGPGAIGIFRLTPPQPANPDGNAVRPLDFTAPPASAGPGAITAGSTWNFQYWYRDPNVGAGFNLSDALSATFCP